MQERKLPPAAALIQRESRFAQGSLYLCFDRTPWFSWKLPTEPFFFDGLGAFMWAHRNMEPETRHELAARLFQTCDARHHHKRIGRLDWEEAFSLLRDVGV